MFKIGSFEEEIFKSMKKKLISNKMENDYSFGKLSRAADLLSAAAGLFDKAGMRTEAAEVTKVLHSLAQQLNDKTL